MLHTFPGPFVSFHCSTNTEQLTMTASLSKIHTRGGLGSYCVRCGIILSAITTRVTQSFDPTSSTPHSRLLHHNAYLVQRRPRASVCPSTTLFQANWYGRGSEIWPPTNIEFPVRLEDSFPEGQVPSIALQVQDGGDFVDPADVTATLRRGLRWISFIVLTTTLVFKGAIGPLDIASLLLWAFYNYVLIKLAESDDGLASLPPSGHVPHMIRNPLQTRSPTQQQERQINLEAWCCFLLPVGLLLLGGGATIDATLTEQWWRVALGRPLLWWMAIQVADDVLESRNTLEVVPPIPLPIQYWIRLSSRLCRWGLLTIAVIVTQWPVLVMNTGGDSMSLSSYVYGLLPVMQWIMASSQVFLYWIPVAGIQYMRAYWAAAEAETLTIQPTAAHHYTQAPPFPSLKDS